MRGISIFSVGIKHIIYPVQIKVFKLIFSFFVFFIAAFSLKAQTVTIGSGTGTTSYFPMYYLYNYNYSQQIVMASEITSGGWTGGEGLITKIKFKPGSAVSTAKWKDWVIYIGQTTKTNFTSGTDWVPVSSMTQVFNGSLPANTTAGSWIELTLSTPFAYNGTSNLVIAVDENTDDWGNSPSWAGYYPGANSRGIYYYSDTTNPNPASPPNGTLSGGNNIAQIQFEIYSSPPCSGTPSGGTVSVNPASGNPGSTYTVSASGQTFGTGLTYQWQYNEDNAGWTNAGTASNNYSNYTATAPLTIGTTVKWRLKISCSNGEATSYSSTDTFTTSITYCNPTTTGGNTYYISNFTTSGGLTNINNNSSGSANGYQNFSGISLSATAGTTINYSINVAGGSTYGKAIWVDWNEDGTFQATEQVASSSSYASSPLTGSFTIPAAATPGNKRMRILASYMPPNPSDPCNNAGTGEFEDYMLMVASMTPCSGMPSGGTVIVNPNSGNPGSAYIVSATAFTFGTGLTYQWQSNVDNAGWTNAGAASGTYSNYSATAPATVGSSVQWRLKVTCSNGGAVSFSTVSTYTVVITYCNPTTTGGNTYYINNFTTSGGLTNINNNSAGSTNGYQDFTGVSLSAIAGTTINYSISAAGGSTYGKAIWVDWNEDGTFQATEQVANSSSYASPPLTGNFTIPAAATPGNKRMRILASYTPSNPTDPCNNSGSGEFEDYTLSIVIPAPCTGTPNAGTVSVNPASGNVGSSYTVSATGYSFASGLSYQWQSNTDNAGWIDEGTPTSYYSDHTAIAPAPVGTSVKWRLRISCSNSGLSANSTVATFTSSISYCTPTYTSGCSVGDRITNVKLNGETINLDNNSTCSTGAYGNYTSMNAPDLITGFQYTISVSTDYGTPSSEDIRIWIDYNNNGVFEPTEEIANTNGGGMSGATENFSFIPQNMPGTHRMRVRMVWLGGNSIDPCSVENYGETEDYMVNILLPGPCSGTPDGGIAMVNPIEAMPGANYTVSATGFTAATGLTFQWQFRTNSGAWDTSLPVTNSYASYIATAPSPVSTTVDWRLKIECTNSGQSVYSTIANFKSVAVSYCQPSSSVTTYYIKSVQFVGTLNADTTNPETGYTPGGFGDYKNLTNQAKQIPGGVINVRVNTEGSYAHVKAWVDWNTDGTFGTTGQEVVFDSGSISSSSNIFGFVVPAGTPPGLYTIRIRTYQSDYTFGPCGATYNGETEDYRFQVIEDCAAKITAVNINSGDGVSCGQGNVTVSAQGTSGTTSYRWYTSQFGDSLISGENGSAMTLENLQNSATFYVTAVNGSCESIYRVPVTAVINPIPTLDFEITEGEVCGMESAVKIKSTGEKEVYTLLNEEFSSGLGAFKNVRGEETYTDTDWINRDSPYQPTHPPFYIVSPAIASGYNGGKYAASITDVQQTSGVTRMLELKNNLNASDLTELKVDFDIYYEPEFENDLSKGFLTLEASSNGGSTWQQIVTYTTIQGNPGVWNHKSVSIPADFQTNQLKIRFKHFGNGYGTEWFANIAAIDNIRVHGKRELSASMNWSGISGALYEADCITPFAGASSQICVKPTDAQLENDEFWTVAATATLANGCQASGNITVVNNSKVWNPSSGDNWANTNKWKPSTPVPTANNCVIVKKTVNINAGTNGLARNITVVPGGKLNIKKDAVLTLTDYMKNQAGVSNFTVAHDGNLIQLNDNAANSGQITVEKEFQFSNLRKEYNFVSLPVDGQDLKTIYTPNSPNVQAYNESTDYFNNTNGPYTVTRAYAVKEAPGSGTQLVTASFKGTPGNGVMTYNLLKNGQGFNLVGNPYPSNLDVVKLYNANSARIKSDFYFWDNRNNQIHQQMGPGYTQDQYAKFNAAASSIGTGTPAPNTTSVPLRTPVKDVKSGTGFIIQANTAGPLHFENAYRSTVTGPDFFGKTTDEGGDPGTIHPDRYWLSLITPAEMQVVNAVVYFEGGNNGIGMEDTESFDPSDDIYTLTDNKHLIIQGRRPFTQEDQLPLGYKSYSPGYHIIKIYEKEGVFENGQDIYLIDHLLNKTWNLSVEPYRFLSRSGEFNNRFTIVYKPQLTENGIAHNQIQIMRKDNKIVVTSSLDKLSEVEIFDLNSHSMLRKIEINKHTFSTDAVNFNHQIIIVKVKTETGETINRKFIIN